MQTVSSAWTAEEKDSVRTIAQSLLVSWKKETNLANRTFTIGVSIIGGPDGIGIDSSAVGGPGIYKYFNEKEYAMSLSWERGYNIPLGGLSKGLAEAELDNTSGRFTPRYIGGTSELYTSILPRRPFIFNAGFHYGGIDNSVPVFSGTLTKQPQIDARSKRVNLRGADYVDFFQNRYLDRETMYTSIRTDQVYENLLLSMGLSTAQYELDYGINIIPFLLFDKGTKYSEIFHDLAQAEYGHFYQDEEGIFRFENRQHWDSAPFTQVQRIIRTSQVIDAEVPDEDHIINVVEIEANPRSKQPRQQLFKLSSPLQGNAGVNIEMFVNFDDPVIQVDDPILQGNTEQDGTGTSLTPTLVASDIFAKAAKYIFRLPSDGYITNIEIFGRPARVDNPVYYRAQDDSSVTAYEEQPISIKNDYIQDRFWANSYAQMILEDFSEPENLQKLTIRAIPELQIGDLVSWQGRHWRVFDIKAKLNPDNGFTQELSMLQRTIVTYFRIGISTIGGSDRIAP